MQKIKFNKKEREVINLGTSLAAGCKPCTRYHLKKCSEAGISDNEIQELIDWTTQISKKAIEIMQSGAKANMGVDHRTDVDAHLKGGNRNYLLVGLSVSCTLNNTELLEYYLSHADKLEMSNSEISYILETSKFIFGKAKAHVELLSERRGIKRNQAEDDECKPGCGC